jgi:hypothetical protein
VGAVAPKEKKYIYRDETIYFISNGLWVLREEAEV